MFIHVRKESAYIFLVPLRLATVPVVIDLLDSSGDKCVN